MAVSSVTVLAPADGQAMPDTITQPAVTFEWAGGVGPYDVEVVWDDDPLFGDANGNRQTTSDTGVSQDITTLSPASDLDDLTVEWFVRVTVTDTDDSGSDEAEISFEYFATNPFDRANLYLLANLGVGFDPTDEPVEFSESGDPWGVSIGGTQGPDGDTIEFRRHLYLLANAGVGFKHTDEPPDGWGTGGNPDGGDGDEITFNRYLYLLKNIDGTQPCPYIFSLSTPIAREGDAIVVRGQGLVSADSPDDTFGVQVRLYSSPDHEESSSNLTIVSYTAGDEEDTITFLAPDTSGFIAVVHTSGATCDGSNFVFLTVDPLDDVEDAGWWIEAWTLDGATRKIANVPVERASVQKILNGVGSGRIDVPADYPRLAEIIDPTPRSSSGDRETRVQSLLKLYQDGRIRRSFFAEQIDQELRDPTESSAVISGDGIESYLSQGILYPQDHPNARIRAGDWQFGATTNQMRNGGAEDSPELVGNGDFEQGDTEGWEAVAGAALFADNTVFRNGNWSLRIGSVGAQGDGAERSLSVQPGQMMFVSGWVRDDAASNQTAQMELYYVDEDDNEQSLDTDTVSLAVTWRELSVSAEVPDDVTQVFLRVTNEAGSDWVRFYLDDTHGVASVEPWFPNDDAELQLDDSLVAEGTYSIKVIASGLFDGALQVIPVTPGQQITISGAASGTAGDQLVLRAVIDGTAVTDQVVLTGDPDFDVLTISGQVGADQTTVRAGFLTEESSPNDFWVDAASAVPGNPATSAGGIVQTLLEPVQARGELALLTTDFDENLDSNGEAWNDTAISVTLRRGATVLELLQKLAGYGIDWEFTDDFVLRLFNRRGVDRTLLADCPVLRTGTPSVVDGKMIRRIPKRNAVFAEGADGIWTTAENPDDESDLGRRATYLEATQATSAATLQAAADNLLADEDARTSSMRLDLSDFSRTRPFLRFVEGDTVLVDAPGIAPMEEFPEGHRVIAITGDYERENPEYSVDLNWMVLEEAAAEAAALRLLMERSKIVSSSPGSSSLGDAGSGGSFIYQAPAEHDHVISDIIDFVGQEAIQPGDPAGGDLAGTYPDPRVVRVRNKLVAEPTTKGDLWVYNGTSLSRVPVGSDDQVLKADSGEATGVKWATDETGGGGGGGGSGFDERVNPANRSGSPDFVREFESPEDPDDATAVSPNALSIVLTQDLSKMSFYHPGGDSADHSTGMLWAWTPPSGDWYVEAAWRVLTNSGNFYHSALLLADGVTVGSGSQLAGPQILHTSGAVRHATYTGFNNRTSSTDVTSLSDSRELPVYYARVFWDDSASLWRFFLSPDGISWIPMGTRSFSLSPTHIGFQFASWTNSFPAVLSAEYLAGYEGSP